MLIFYLKDKVTLNIIKYEGSKLQFANASHELVDKFRSKEYNEIFWIIFDKPNYWEHAQQSFPVVVSMPCRYLSMFLCIG